MVRRVQIEAVDATPRGIVAVGNDYPDGHAIAPHQHRRGQLISSVTGTLVVATPQGSWVMPPQRGMWIPPATVHDVKVIGAVSMQSLYLEPSVAQDLPGQCQVLGISPFMRSLMTEALELPVEYELDGRGGALMTLLRHEMRRLPVLPLSLPLPRSEGLAALCRRFIRRPRAHDSIEDWCAALGMTRRSFTRVFRQETGLSFVEWRQQACLVAALPLLAMGEPVTSVAMGLGYDNPAAFTAMFKRVLGVPPRAYLAKP